MGLRSLISEAYYHLRKYLHKEGMLASRESGSEGKTGDPLGYYPVRPHKHKPFPCKAKRYEGVAPTEAIEVVIKADFLEPISIFNTAHLMRGPRRQHRGPQSKAKP